MHVLSVLDPERPDLEAFGTYGEHHRVTLRFHDIIDPEPARIMPEPEHMRAILDFGTLLADPTTAVAQGHLLVHCHMGISRSTAAMLALIAQGSPGMDDDALFERLRAIRPQAWPNSVMVGFADEMLGRGGGLVAALRRHYGHQLGQNARWRDWMTELKRGREVAMAV